jgi:hypothetical protein
VLPIHSFNYIINEKHARNKFYFQIPFTKFLFTTAGYLQDRQPTFHRYKTIGISIMDRINGPFCLELDYMKLRETFYQPKYFVEHAGRDLDY